MSIADYIFDATDRIARYLSPQLAFAGFYSDSPREQDSKLVNALFMKGIGKKKGGGRKAPTRDVEVHVNGQTYYINPKDKPKYLTVPQYLKRIGASSNGVKKANKSHGCDKHGKRKRDRKNGNGKR